MEDKPIFYHGRKYKCDFIKLVHNGITKYYDAEYRRVKKRPTKRTMDSFTWFMYTVKKEIEKDWYTEQTKFKEIKQYDETKSSIEGTRYKINRLTESVSVQIFSLDDEIAKLIRLNYAIAEKENAKTKEEEKIESKTEEETNEVVKEAVCFSKALSFVNESFGYDDSKNKQARNDLKQLTNKEDIK